MRDHKQRLKHAGRILKGVAFILLLGLFSGCHTNTASQGLTLLKTINYGGLPATAAKQQTVLSFTNGQRYQLRIVAHRQRGCLVELQADDDYRLQLNPLGGAWGNINHIKTATELQKKLDNDDHSSHPDMFSVRPVHPSKIEIYQTSENEHMIRVYCAQAIITTGNEKRLLYDDYRFDVRFKRDSPVLIFESLRVRNRRFYNHNGVFLNTLYVDTQPSYLDGILLQNGQAKQGIKDPVAIPFNGIAKLTGADVRTTILYQPDFQSLGNYRPMLVESGGHLKTVISQSWRQGWKAINQPAKTVKDHLFLVFDVQDPSKTLSEWEKELKQLHLKH